MWTHREWPGRSIPRSNPAGNELTAYASVVNAVEGNTTFYALPDPKTAEKWAAAVPDGFRFMFKLPRVVTHDRRLRDAREEVALFLSATRPCHHLMEPIAIQLPASFAPGDLDVLGSFLGKASDAFRWAVEVRHQQFFDGGNEERRLNDLLFAAGADRIILDSRAVFAGPRETPAENEAFENKPRVPARAVATNDQPVVRFIGQTAAEANPPFWAPWVETIIRWIEDGRRPTVFIHTPDNVVAPELCRLFHAEVRARIPALEPLPEAPPVDEPSLFD
jgi:uncharacterized protein YecE (DUF72 family)